MIYFSSVIQKFPAPHSERFVRSQTISFRMQATSMKLLFTVAREFPSDIYLAF
jgi:hypothetical protein